MMPLHQQPHRRWNPLTQQWILVSPQRTQRPWQGAQESEAEQRAQYDAQCYLCPGNTRANGEKNPAYTHTFVFTNDYPALLPEHSAQHITADAALLQASAVSGECRVLCFSPRHDLTLSGISIAGLVQVVQTWCEQTTELSQRYQYVQLFENKGSAMGCSNPHPHGQIWASDFVPNEIAKETQTQLAYYQMHGRSLLSDYTQLE
ncbi:MAG: galactose-1-phosphate uridylyltransferase, partial [Gammaproteobacteria bacterium]|nr:galactose-1-phosphate uridylyltransferase [Gammaproteobacteria bacterium]